MKIKLSEAQERAVKYSKYSRSGDRYFINTYIGVSKPTIYALIKKGIVSDDFRYWLTDLGETLRRKLTD